MTPATHHANELADAADDRLIVSPDEAEALLSPGKYVHNFVQAGFALIGCDYDRADAIAAFKAAKLIEIGGDQCKRIGHALAVHSPDGTLSFFAADKDAVSAFEASQQSVPA